MPVTARLSKRFYDRLGDDIANELVDWFNTVDATYRLDLRELNESNFARFDAKVDQRFAESEAKWEKRFAELDAKWETRFAQFEASVDRRFAELRVELATRETRIVRWMFLFWSTNLLALTGLALATLGSR